MKKFCIYILLSFLLLINLSVNAAQNVVKKDIKVIAADDFNIEATLTYSKVKSKKEYKTVILLHSLGYNSQWWENLPELFLNKGYAVVMIDLRGHGQSIYNSKLVKTSWKNMTNSAFAKYPDDILKVIDKIKEENTKTTFFNDWAIVGADIGASSGIIAADKSHIKPKTIVLISPVIQTKNLYIPISMAHLSNVDFLSISGTNDIMSKDAENYLVKFAQKEFLTYTSSAKTTGMMMLKNDPELSKIIAEWIDTYLDE